jgi:protein-S-isoprenylcysteine O-methyltransferase Ste14
VKKLILKKNRDKIKKSQTKTTKTSMILGIVSIITIILCILAAVVLYLLASALMVMIFYILIALILIALFISNLLIFKKNKREFESLKQPNNATELAYKKSRKFNLLAMILMLCLLVGGGLLILTMFGLSSLI